MNIFSSIYNFFFNFAATPSAVYVLSALSYFEAFILPYPPPDIMLAPMVLRAKRKYLYFAIITTFFSVLGGITGYLIGEFAYSFILPFLEKMNLGTKIDIVRDWFDIYGVWVVIIAGFSPVPYKIFTIMAGFLNMALIPFIICGVIGRGARFFLVALLVNKFGDAIDSFLKKYIDYLGYLVVFIFVAYLIWQNYL